MAELDKALDTISTVLQLLGSSFPSLRLDRLRTRVVLKDGFWQRLRLFEFPARRVRNLMEHEEKTVRVSKAREFGHGYFGIVLQDKSLSQADFDSQIR